MTSCAIIEDDRHTVSMLSAIIEDYFDDINIIGNASSIIKGLSLINTHKPQLLLLDINLKDGESFEILDNLETRPPKIIFITSLDVNAEKALQYNGVIGFIKKPFEPKEVFKIVSRALNQIHLETSQSSNNELSRKITFNNKSEDTNELLFVALSDIIYVESQNNKTFVHTINKAKIKVNKTLKQFENDFPKRYFFRTNQSFLVNLNYVERFDNDTYEAILKNEVYIPVSQNKKLEFIKTLEFLQ